MYGRRRVILGIAASVVVLSTIVFVLVSNLARLDRWAKARWTPRRCRGARLDSSGDQGQQHMRYESLRRWLQRLAKQAGLVADEGVRINWIHVLRWKAT
jgi:hypothetical protein